MNPLRWIFHGNCYRISSDDPTPGKPTTQTKDSALFDLWIIGYVNLRLYSGPIIEDHKDLALDRRKLTAEPSGYRQETLGNAAVCCVDGE